MSFLDLSVQSVRSVRSANRSSAARFDMQGQPDFADAMYRNAGARNSVWIAVSKKSGKSAYRLYSRSAKSPKVSSSG